MQKPCSLNQEVKAADLPPSHLVRAWKIDNDGWVLDETLIDISEIPGNNGEVSIVLWCERDGSGAVEVRWGVPRTTGTIYARWEWLGVALD